MGDFNQVVSSTQKLGGSPVNLCHSMAFSDRINNMNLIDLGFVSPKFTWSNLQSFNNLILERLDRTLANSRWKVLFLNNVTIHFSRWSSDHCPMLLDTELMDSHPPRKVRFESIWLNHSDFHNVVSSSWG
ncbi:hypothetical protein CFOL_v3_23345 [Cephalotus follicularis]|uniref:Exo_endo_phos domain-containing protein n=1 Tax=Cephalotus follicularis TaxID=3775 RepID=A0A1Q3CIF0_CEPFO|nr:hypothetical protein CFOL_v3_23345 [Cephalotus follicularis]